MAGVPHKELLPVDLNRIFPTYVITKTPVKVLEDLVHSSASEWPSKKYLKSPYLLSILRSKAEAFQETERIKSLPTLSGTEPPIQQTKEYDFLGWNLYDLAVFTLSAFPSDTGPISNRYMLIVDDRSLQDRTVILAEIPDQRYAVEPQEERKFNRRDEYTTDPNGWLSSEGKDEDVDEIKVVRLRFEDANAVNMIDDMVEDMTYLAQHTFMTNGVYMMGAEYKYPPMEAKI